MLKITREFTFEACHWLPKVSAGHKCAEWHGHSYRVRCEVFGENDPELGWIVDTAYIDDAWEQMHARLDHKKLNDTIDNPTTENLAIWLQERFWKVFKDFPNIHKIGVHVQESPRSTAYYEG
mgnify:FL=1